MYDNGIRLNKEVIRAYGNNGYFNAVKESDYDELLKYYNDIVQKYNYLKNNIEQQNTQIEYLKNKELNNSKDIEKINELTAKIRSLDYERESLLSKNKSLEIDLQNFKANIIFGKINEKNENNTLKEKIEDLSKNKIELDKINEKCNNDIKELNNELNNIKEENKLLKIELEECHSNKCNENTDILLNKIKYLELNAANNKKPNKKKSNKKKSNKKVGGYDKKSKKKK